RIYDLEPERFGLRRAGLEELAGGTPEENAAAVHRVFAGEDTGALFDVTALNAGAALYVGGVATTLEEGVEKARATLASGAAAEKLEELRSFAG
ncbi:MAG TPA: anthranilate phosphoribosyltransferase, partial [Thermoanaerobaculia bacterium]|nr:anthranilate phosphoribosyltransferase [Thermoanaerobaculia bacterium]